MTASWPAKHDYATGDVLSATNMNDLAGVVNFMDPTGTTNGYVLTADSTQTGKVKWAAAGGGGGGGKVLQVVSTVFTTQISSSSTTYADTGMSATITPSASTSKVLAIVMHQGCQTVASSGGLSVKFFRSSTELAKIAHYAGVNPGGESNVGTVGVTYLDSPATTSATTYKTQFASSNGSSAAYINSTGGSAAITSTLTLLEIGA